MYAYLRKKISIKLNKMCQIIIKTKQNKTEKHFQGYGNSAAWGDFWFRPLFT